MNEAYIRLVKRDAMAADDRRHLFFIFRRAIHDVFVEQVRAMCARRQGEGDRATASIAFVVEGGTLNADLAALTEAFDELNRVDPGQRRRAAAADLVPLHDRGNGGADGVQLLGCAGPLGLWAGVAAAPALRGRGCDPGLLTLFSDEGPQTCARRAAESRFGGPAR